jgi:hypothetical protein
MKPEEMNREKRETHERCSLSASNGERAGVRCRIGREDAKF